ncbi:hypothetical protein CERZMDRAFT_44642 [Cercospora zeae-maydis SCOH1-5]|uniref:AB hydrolase-1 domain-containing protein n=1 Tax=Cercospora zeae-maydis SCOH1-5 TaxID=717836 RepID=A0A6A6FBS7_9PEZI|nr:hypothetical protein CERZMDRAFT_44642 [Cercospora zeae-maydis SCOH1-5]
MTEATYSFTIPSAHDDTNLDCRIYHPRHLQDLLTGTSDKPRAAVIAHPYAPLGGTYDDPVVLSLVECVLREGRIIVTFNFRQALPRTQHSKHIANAFDRGAGKSRGKTSWTGRPEVDDYASAVGLAIYYVSNICTSLGSDTLSAGHANLDPSSLYRDYTAANGPIELLLAGYSFGSLILSRLPGVPAILERFETAERGTAASEIFMRARTLAKQTKQSIGVAQSPSSSKTVRGRQLRPHDSPTKWQSSVAVGGDELDAAERRRSRDSRTSVDVIRDVPHNIKHHMRRHSEHSRGPFLDRVSDAPASTSHHAKCNKGIATVVRYLMVSPVLVPFSTTLLSPGLPFTEGSSSDEETGVLSLAHPTLIVFGTLDTFTASRKLRMWAEKLQKNSPEGKVRWVQVDGAGHFWRERGVMKVLRSDVQAWLRSDAASDANEMQ